MGQGTSTIPTREDVGARIRTMRLEMNLSQTMFARIAGLNPSTIRATEHGETNVTILTIIKIARAMDVTIEQLVHGI